MSRMREEDFCGNKTIIMRAAMMMTTTTTKTTKTALATLSHKMRAIALIRLALNSLDGFPSTLKC